MTERARELRRTQTRSETVLWEALRLGRFAGTKWRRQQTMGRFVVDFYCSELRVVVEVDGPIHDDRVEADRDRQSALEASGLRVWRVTAADVEQDVEAVLERFREWLAGREPSRCP